MGSIYNIRIITILWMENNITIYALIYENEIKYTELKNELKISKLKNF